MPDTIDHSQGDAGRAVSVGAGTHSAENEDSSRGRKGLGLDWIILPLIAAATIACLYVGTKLYTRMEFVHLGMLPGRCIAQSGSVYHGVPNSVCTERDNHGRIVEYRFNSCGDRTSLDCGRKPEGTYRIVLIGSSNPMGYGVPLQSTLAERLSVELSRRTGRRVEVYNASLNGVGIPANLATEMPRIMALQPDLILWVMSSWDFHPDTVQGEVQEEPSLGNPLELSKLRLPFPGARPSRLLREILYRSQSLYTAAYLRKIRNDAQAHATSDDEERERMRLISLNVKTIVDQAKENGVPVVGAFLPERAGTEAYLMNPCPKGVAADELNYELNAILSSEGAIFVDVLPDLRKALNLDGLYDPLGAHLNAEGHAFLTQLLANALTSGKVPALFERQDTKGEGAQTN